MVRAFLVTLITFAYVLILGPPVLLYAAVTALRHKPLESRYIVVDTTAWYWHFMALLWIYIFALLELAR